MHGRTYGRFHEEARMNERLGKMHTLGQAPWVDELSREDIKNGGLQRMIDDGIVGITSNPSIFQKAIGGSDLYDDQLQELARTEDDPKEIFWSIASDDIRDACDIFAPVYERTGGEDGFVSLEVQPDIAHDIQGIQRLVENGGDPSGVRSVASFFVSRIDVEANKRLEELGAEDLKDKLAIANAKLAYRVYKQVFGGARWRSLEEKGANRQRLLWASTSTKDPELPDTIYVDNLVGPETVNTMPKKTIEAVKDHGEIRPTLEEGIEEANELFHHLRDVGLDYEGVTDN